MERWEKIDMMILDSGDPMPRLAELNKLILNISAQYSHRLLLVDADYRLVPNPEAEPIVAPHISSSVIPMPTGENHESRELAMKLIEQEHEDLLLMDCLFTKGFNYFLTKQQRQVYSSLFFKDILETQHVDCSLKNMSGVHRKFYRDTAKEIFLECVGLDQFNRDGILMDVIARKAAGLDRINLIDPEHKFDHNYILLHKNRITEVYPIFVKYIDPKHLI